MIDPDIRVTDINARQFNNFFNMISPAMEEKPRLILVYSGSDVIKAVHTTRGRMEHIKVWEGPGSLRVLAAEEGAEGVIAMQPNTIRKIAFEYQNKLSLNQSYDQQLWLMLRAAGEHLGKDLHIYPDLIGAARLVPYKLISLAGKLIMPGSGTAALFVFEDSEIFTSAILGFENHRLSMVTSFDALEAHEFVFLDWKAEYNEIVRDIEREFGPLRLGIFVDKAWLDSQVAAKMELREIVTAIRDRKLALYPPIPTPVTILALKILSQIPARKRESAARDSF